MFNIQSILNSVCLWCAGSSFFDLRVIVHFPNSICWIVLSFPSCVVLLFPHKICLTILVWLYLFWTPYSVQLLCGSVFMPAPHCWGYYSFVICHGIRKFCSFLSGLCLASMRVPMNTRAEPSTKTHGEEGQGEAQAVWVLASWSMSRDGTHRGTIVAPWFAEEFRSHGREAPLLCKDQSSCDTAVRGS